MRNVSSVTPDSGTARGLKIDEFVSVSSDDGAVLVAAGTADIDAFNGNRK